MTTNTVETRTYRFGGKGFQMAKNKTYEEIRAALGTIRPEARTSKFVEEDDGSVSIINMEGTKGC